MSKLGSAASLDGRCHDLAVFRLDVRSSARVERTSGTEKCITLRRPLQILSISLFVYFSLPRSPLSLSLSVSVSPLYNSTRSVARTCPTSCALACSWKRIQEDVAVLLAALLPAKVGDSWVTTVFFGHVQSRLSFFLIVSMRVRQPGFPIHMLSTFDQVLLVDENTCSDGEAFAEAFQRFGLGTVPWRIMAWHINM